MTGRSVVVTGGFGALGRVVAQSFAKAGDSVARIDFAAHPAEPLDGVLDIAGVDLTDAQGAARAVAQVVEAHGSLAVLVNVAGGFLWEGFEDGSLSSWERMQAVNVTTALNMCRAALPHLVATQDGRIVNIGAGAAVKAEMGMGPYAASKAAVHRLTEALAAELSSKGITVNAILPSIIDTPANRADMPDADFGAWVQPQAIADAIFFLASREARGITGALVPLTRGG